MNNYSMNVCYIQPNLKLPSWATESVTGFLTDSHEYAGKMRRPWNLCKFVVMVVVIRVFDEGHRVIILLGSVVPQENGLYWETHGVQQPKRELSGVGASEGFIGKI